MLEMGIPGWSKISFLWVTQEGRAGGTGPSVPRLVLPVPACFELPRSDVSWSSSQTPQQLESPPCLQRLMGQADFQVGSFAQKWVSKRAGRRQALAKAKIHLPSSCDWARPLTG